MLTICYICAYNFNKEDAIERLKLYIDHNYPLDNLNHINPDRFNPVCNLTIDPRSHEPIFEFSEEWISDSEVDNYIAIIKTLYKFSNFIIIMII